MEFRDKLLGEPSEFVGRGEAALEQLMEICHKETEHADHIARTRKEDSEVEAYFSGYRDAMRLIRDVLGDYFDFWAAKKDEDEPDRIILIAGVPESVLNDWLESL